MVGNASAPSIGPWSRTPQGWFLAAYGSRRRLGTSTLEQAERAADPVLARVLNLFSEDAALAGAVDWLKDVHVRALEGRPGFDRLKADLIGLLNDGLLPGDVHVDRVDADGLWVRVGGVTLPLPQLSDGYNTVAALVLDLARRLYSTYGSLRLERAPSGELRCGLPGVVLIDEVDAHLHPSWQQRIGVWLTRHFPALQFLVTTHSPFVCQAASPGGLFRLPGPGELRRASRVDERLHHAIVNGSADDAVMSELFGLEHAHSDEAEALRDELARLEVRVLDGRATPAEQQRYAAIKAELPESMDELADQSVRALLARRSRG